MNTKVRMKMPEENETSYYPGVQHNSWWCDVELEEYIWSIHKEIDWSLYNTTLRDNIINATGIPKSYLIGESVFRKIFRRK